jgi:DNA-binding HxlR family transcriptional regulator
MSMQKVSKEAIWMLRGNQRKEVFLSLPTEPFMANKLRKKLEHTISLREMSRHLRDFEEQKLVVCLNKDDPYNKLYQITDKGKKLQKEVNSLS